jgi:hypothetical protein
MRQTGPWMTSEMTLLQMPLQLCRMKQFQRCLQLLAQDQVLRDWEHGVLQVEGVELGEGVEAEEHPFLQIITASDVAKLGSTFFGFVPRSTTRITIHRNLCNAQLAFPRPV